MRYCLNRSIKWVILGLAIVVAGLTLPPVFGISKQIIENPEKPLAKNAGRVLELKEVWRITDEEGTFYFKRPADLRIAPDGSVFVVDEAEMLKFSLQGKYIRNLFKPGQGPGEIQTEVPAFTIREKELIIYDFMARNIVIFDFEGNLVRQWRVETGPYAGFHGLLDDRFVFRREIYPPPSERKPGRTNMPVKIESIGPDGKNEKTHGQFMKDMVIRGNGFTTWTGYFTAMDEKNGRIYVAPTREYGIEIIDLAAGRTTKIFRRKYQSVPYRERGWEEAFYKANEVPKIKIEQDIVGLFWTGASLWVKTSTTNLNRGDLFDVFDGEGRFLDSFFLGPGRSLLKIIGDEIFVTEKNADESIVLVKYRINGEGNDGA